MPIDVPDAKDAKYRALPKLSPYANKSRYNLLKEDHKYYAEHLRKHLDTSKVYTVADVGCGNGELIYALMRFYPHWKYTGYDYTSEFIETAKAFEGLKDARLFTSDLYSVKETFDIVLCSSVLQTFADIEKPLTQLISNCNPGGWLFVDGLFNKYDVEVRLQYCDNSNPHSEGLWRTDWNQHSRKTVGRFLKEKVTSFQFDDVLMDLDMAPNPQIHINRFTFRDSKSRNIITNGTNVMLNRTLLTIHR